MDISGGINRAVNFYTADTGNKLNLAGGSNKIYGSDVFSAESAGAQLYAPEAAKAVSKPAKKHRKNRRLNTLDSDFLPDEAEEIISETDKNFFTEQKIPPVLRKIKQAADYFLANAPLVNYFYLKQKGQRLQTAAEKLNDIVQNTDELINSKIPYGEDGVFYDNIAKNLIDAANIIGKADKNFKIY